MVTTRCVRIAAALLVGLTVIGGGGYCLVEAAESGDTAIIPTVVQRYSAADSMEEPDFQKHVIPMISRLGCNGRACHGSFQGQGGLALSLFGYDFKADFEALAGEAHGRIDREDVDASLIISKPTDEDMHEGGQRYELGGWEHRLLHNWIAAGAKFDAQNVHPIERLEITPEEIVFTQDGQQAQLTVIAVWADGTREDVTPLARYTTNNDQIAMIDRDGVVQAADPGDTHVVIAYDKEVVAIPVIQPYNNQIAANYPEVPTPTQIDTLVVQKLRKLGVIPSDLSDDAQFLRRVSLDIAGTLPSAKEVREFVADTAADKRAKKIDQLLESPAYVAKWTTMLCDLTGNNDQQLVQASPMRNSGAQEWYDWIYRRVEENKPYDQLAEGIILAKSREEGESYEKFCETMSDLYRDGGSYADRSGLAHFWARRDFRQPDDRAIGFAYAFMGVRIECAQCHKHPFDVWSKDDFDEFKTFFTQAQLVPIPRPNLDREAFADYSKIIESLDVDKDLRGNMLQRELVGELRKGKTVPFPEVTLAPPRAQRAQGPRARRNQPRKQTGRILGAEEVELAGDDDYRNPVMQWLKREDNPYFAKAFVNRVWASYFNVGIVHPTDDLSLGNPPSNEPLLDYLASEFVRQGYDMKWLHREIAGSRTYQLSWQPNDTNRADQRNFSRSIPRRLPAEVAYDILQQATAGQELNESYLTSLDRRAVAIAGTRVQGDPAYPLQIFGRSERASNCDCDRSLEATLLQTVYMQNDNSVLQAISGPRGWIAETHGTAGRGDAMRGNQGPNRGNQQPGAAAAMRVRIQRLNQQIETAEARLAQLKQLEDQTQYRELAERVATMKERRANVRQQIARMNNQRPGQQRPGQMGRGQMAENRPAPRRTAPAMEHPQLVEEAYLRTLSRLPSDEELQISLAHLKDSEDPATAAGDLLWALINTKEFIVNH